MSKAKLVISSLADRNSRIENAIVTFRTLQSQYKISLHIENSFELSTIRVVAVFYYIVSIILSKRLKEITKSLKMTHIQEQRITKEKKESLVT